MSTRDQEPVPAVQQKRADAAHVRTTTGEPLPKALASEMSTRFGVSFGDVRLHRDSVANDVAKKAGAQALTHGDHISFAAGKYDPASASGRSLIAHELTHVVQQRRGGRSPDTEERANRAAFDVVSGRSVNPMTVGGAPASAQAQPAEETDTKPAPKKDDAADSSANTFTTVLDKFATKKDTLTASHKKSINEIATGIGLSLGIRLASKAKIEIVGHADTVGKDPDNATLGQKRADQVRAALEQQLTPAEGTTPLKLEWSVRSAGEGELLVPTPDNTPSERNRAVEVRVTIEAVPAPPKPAEAPKIDLSGPKIYEEPKPPVGPYRDPAETELWRRMEENDRRIKELDKKIGKPKDRSVQDVIVDVLMEPIDKIIKELPIDKDKKKWLREKARDGIKAGTEKGCESAIDASGAKGEEAEALKAACKAAIQQKPKEEKK